MMQKAPYNVADEQAHTPLDREQVVALIGKHAKKLAEVAREQGCTTLSYLLQAAAEQADKDLSTQPGNGGSSVS